LDRRLIELKEDVKVLVEYTKLNLTTTLQADYKEIFNSYTKTSELEAKYALKSDYTTTVLLE